MLESLELKNFKSFLDQRFDFKPLTILAGLNGSGKSSIVEAVNLIHNLHTKTWFEHLRLNFNLNQFAAFRSLLSRNQGYNVSACWNEKNVFLNALFDDGQLSIKTEETYDFSDSDLQILKASRIGPQSNYTLNPLSNEPKLDCEAKAVVDYILKLNDNNTRVEESLKYGDSISFKDNVNDWLQIVSVNSNFTIEIAQDRKRAQIKYNGIDATETGFGLSYSLPIIATLLDPNIKLLIIENPEAHLHPKGQSELCKLIAKAVACGKQVVLETHSDHIVDGIRVAVKHQLINCEDAAIYFLERDIDAPSRVIQITIDSEGELSEWPNDFVDQTIKDAGALL